MVLQRGRAANEEEREGDVSNSTGAPHQVAHHRTAPVSDKYWIFGVIIRGLHGIHMILTAFPLGATPDETHFTEQCTALRTAYDTCCALPAATRTQALVSFHGRPPHSHRLLRNRFTPL